MENTQILFSESNPTYRSNFKLYQRWCNENEKDCFDDKAILPFMSAMYTDGYPNDKPKKVSTLKARFLAIKNHYNLNTKEMPNMAKITEKLNNLEGNKNED